MKRSGIKRHRTRSPRNELLRQLQQTFHKTVCAHACVMCAVEVLSPEVRKAFAAEIAKREAHHVTPRADLRSQRQIADDDPLTWDPQNGVCLCRYHHQRHENFVQRLPRDLVPQGAVCFAAALGLSWLLDREYPREAAA